jgi:hypothetical protein
MKPVLKIDWATHEAARYAVENWHYSEVLPVPPLVKVGAWEDGKFIGVVIFSRGANNNLLRPFGLTCVEGCELTRVALTQHKTPVSRIIRMGMMFLKKNSPSLRLIVSFADPSEGHHGGIYQAGNWVYTGRRPPTTEFLAPDGKQWHGRMVSKDGRIKVQGKYRPCWKTSQCTPVEKQGKHRYLMPLDNEMRKQILPLAKAYPKRAGSDTSDTPAFQAGEGGSLPTPALHSQPSPNP